MGKDGPKQGGDKKSKSHDVTLIPRLKDLGISPMQSSRWQTVASLPEKEFNQHISEVKKSNDELTTVGVIKLARQLVKSVFLLTEF